MTTLLATTQAAIRAAVFGLSPIDASADQPALVLLDTHSSAGRLSIYRNNVMGSLASVLAAGFPATQARLGEALFKQAARRFVIDSPPTQAHLLAYGAGFGDWLAAQPPVISTAADAPDLARLEWARLEAYHAADVDALAPGALAALPPDQVPQVVLIPHPATRLVQSAHTVDTLWRQLRQAAAGDGAAQELSMPAPLEAQELILVLRPALSVQTRVLDPVTAALWDGCGQGQPLGQIFEGLIATAGVAAAQQRLAALLAFGAFAGYRTGPPGT